MTVARLKLKITPLLDKVFIYRSLLSLFYNHGAGDPWCLASLANGSQLWPRRTLLRRRMHGTVFQSDAFTPSLVCSLHETLLRTAGSVVRCDEDVLWLRNPGSESLVSGNLEGYHIPPGCGKTEHLRLTSLLQSPFNFVSNVDNDTEFVAIGQAILRPYGSTFQRPQDVQLSMATV